VGDAESQELPQNPEEVTRESDYKNVHFSRQNGVVSKLKNNHPQKKKEKAPHLCFWLTGGCSVTRTQERKGKYAVGFQKGRSN